MDERILRWIKRAQETEASIRADSSHPRNIDIDLLELMLDLEGECQSTTAANEREACAALTCKDCGQGVPVFLINGDWRHRTDRGEWDCEADDIRQRKVVLRPVETVTISTHRACAETT